MKTFEAPFKTTRGALERTLLGLGYVPHYGENEFGFPFVDFHHAGSGARVTLAVVPEEERLYDGDLLRAEHSVEWWGVTDSRTFYRLLREATPAEIQTA